VRTFLRNNGLSVALFALFLFSLAGQVLTGHHEYNADQRDHDEPEIGLAGYLGTGHFVEAVFENWESEFLQMASYVLLTVFLRQKGSPESKKLDEEEAVDEEPPAPKDAPKDAPWPVRRGGLVAALYANSLLIAFGLLFVAAWLLHAAGGVREYNAEQLAHGGSAISFGAYLTTARFWFESFQNWQSEFLAVGLLVVLAIFLRQKGSPESKPVAAPHAMTGSA
jgi:hypothetical protein